MKKKLIPLIISVVIFLAGAAAMVFGIAKNNGDFSDYPELDLLHLSDEDVGKTFSSRAYAEIICIKVTTGKPTSYCVYLWDGSDDEKAGDHILMYFDVPERETDKYEQEYDGPMPICGTIRKSDEVINEKMESMIRLYYDDALTYYEQEGIEYDETMVGETAIAADIERISPYYIEIIEASSGNSYLWIGCAVMAVAVIVLLTALSGKKFLIIFGVAVGLAVVILLIVLSGKLRTMASVTETAEGLYQMTCHYDYKCDEFLNADIGTIDELTDWLIKEHFFGLPVEFDERNFGCSSFTAATPEGQRLFARNFDYSETDTLVIYTEPKDGYASYGVVDLTFFDIGKESALDGNSLPAKALMLCAPYVVMDGINEAGMGVGILQLDIDELHQDNGKSDLLITSAIRGILDKCATVDEALALIGNYDIHSFLDCSYHLFMTDKTGRSVIVEWTDDETFIVEDVACTNDVMSVNEFYDPDWSCRRYDIIRNALTGKNGILTEDEAMSVASDASWGQGKNNLFDTEWSCVYNLDEFTLMICLDTDYETQYTFTRDNFR